MWWFRTLVLDEACTESVDGVNVINRQNSTCYTDNTTAHCMHMTLSLTLPKGLLN